LCKANELPGVKITEDKITKEIAFKNESFWEKHVRMTQYSLLEEYPFICGQNIKIKIDTKLFQWHTNCCSATVYGHDFQVRIRLD